MKSLKVLAVIALTSSSAMAMDTVMGLKGRFDYARSETEQTGSAKTSTNVLTTSFLRLVTDAKLNDTTTAKLTLDFAADSTVENGVQNLVDEAYITKNLMGFSVMLGKQAVMTGGRENDYSSRDVYLTSVFNDTLPDNLTGASVGYSMAGQNLYFQYLQQKSTSQTPLTDKKVVGAAYYGEFMDKMIMPIISYHKLGTARAGSYDTLGSAGLRLNVANFIVEADYLMLEQEKLSALGDAELTSVVAHVRYAHENFQPFAKYITEEGKKGFDGYTANTERTAWELGLEYVPNKDEDMRFHVVYNSSEIEEKSNPVSKEEDKKIFAGVAFNYNILK